MVQLMLVVTTIARHFRLVPVPGHTVGFLPLITMRPREPVLITPELINAPAVAMRYGVGA
jgi:hypothetical protein